MKETKSKTRKVIKAGQGLVITLPVDFCRKAGISKGDKLGVVYDSFLVVISPNPPKEKQ